MRLAFMLSSLVCALAVSVAVVSTVVLGLVYDPSFYHAGQVKYQVQVTTGITQDEIDLVNRGIVRFFVGRESLPTALEVTGASPVVFQLKEILHMNDVRDVIRAIATLQRGSAVLLALFLAATIVSWKRFGRAAVARSLVYSSALTVVVGGLTSALTYFAFDELFLTFHELTFHNDYWELDPRTDHLIQMFPFGFWYDAMLTVALRVVLVTLILCGIGLVLRRQGRLWRGA